MHLKFYKMVEIPACIYKCEICTLTKEDYHHIQATKLIGCHMV